MKKISLIILTFILAFNFSFAQKKKGTQTSTTTTSSEVRSSKSSGMGFGKDDFVISGAFGVTSASGGGGSSATTFKILPSAAYFISDKMAIVGKIGYAQNGGTVSSGVITGASDDLVVAAGLRFYKTPGSQFSLFAQGLIEFTSKSFGGGGSGTQFGIVFNPGINYFVSNSFSIEATFGEVGFRSLSRGGASNTDIVLGLDLSQIGFGLNYKF